MFDKAKKFLAAATADVKNFVEFKKAIPYMEKAHEINPTDKFTLESLKTLYYRLKMLDKHAEIIEKIKNNQ